MYIHIHIYIDIYVYASAAVLHGRGRGAYHESYVCCMYTCISVWITRVTSTQSPNNQTNLHLPPHTHIHPQEEVLSTRPRIYNWEDGSTFNPIAKYTIPE